MSSNAPAVRDISLADFGARNIILTGTSTRYHIPSFAGPPSIKWVRQGTARWRVQGADRVVYPDALLLLPDGEEYALTIDSPTPSRTFCPVFRSGCVENALFAIRKTHEALLDQPQGTLPATFRPHRVSTNGDVGNALACLAHAFDQKADPETLGWAFETLAAAFAASALECSHIPERLCAAKAATRHEIYSRLSALREAVEDELGFPWNLDAMGRVACMAPHHFHRCFHQAFAETPRDWLARRRCERAMALLQTTAMTVTEVCMAIGYSSLGSFSAAFSRRFGKSPSTFSRAKQGRV